MLTWSEAAKEINSRRELVFVMRDKYHGWVCPLCGSGSGKDGTGVTESPEAPGHYRCWNAACPSHEIPNFKGSILDWLGARDDIDLFDYKAVLENGCRVAGIDFASLKKDKVSKASFRRDKGTESIQSMTPEQATLFLEESQTNLEGGRAYIESRGISMENAKRHGLGYSCKHDVHGKSFPVIVIPCGQYYITRTAVECDKGYRHNAVANAPKPPIWYECLDETDVVFIVEGAFDALSIEEVGGRAISLNSADNTDVFLKYLDEHPYGGTILLALDEDDSGQGATRKLEIGLKARGISYRRVNISGGYKDPNEYLVADRGSFVNAVQEALHMPKQERISYLEWEYDWSDSLDDFMENVQTDAYRFRKTGIAPLDKAIGGGFMGGWLVLVGGAPGRGKTAVLQWLAECMVEHTPSLTCLFFNYEMSRDQLLARSLARRTGYKATKMLQGFSWTSEEKKQIRRVVNAYKKSVGCRLLYNPDNDGNELPSMRLQDTMLIAEDVATTMESLGRPAPMLICDYIQLLKDMSRDEQEDIKNAMAQLKRYAIKHDAVVLAAMANNREGNKGGKASMYSGRGSSSLEYGTDLQLQLVYKHENEDKEFQDISKRRLVVTKGRWASPNTGIDFTFDGETMNIKNIKYFNSNKKREDFTETQMSKTMNKFADVQVR